jgi:hypothetical protein
MNGWQPIETAPMGQRVLAFTDGYGVRVAQVEEGGRVWIETYGTTATHWMPLPDPPKESK